MALRKKGFSASQSERMSRKMQNQTIGTHVAPAQRGRHAKGPDPTRTPVDFSNARRERQASRRTVTQLDPETKSGESAADYSRRTGRAGYIEAVQIQSRKRRLMTFLFIAIIALVVAVAVGAFTFFSSTDARLSSGTSNASESLVAVDPDNAYFVLMEASLGTAKNPRDPVGDAFLLVRVDEAGKVLTFVSLPSTIELRMRDGESRPLYQAEEAGGEAMLIDAVSTFAGVDISHYVRTDVDGLSSLVELLGGVTMDLTSEVDDPQAGSIYIAPGVQTLDAAQSMVLLRAKNFYDGLESQAANRITFTYALAQQALSNEGFDFAAKVSDLAACIETDWSAAGIIEAGDALRPFSEVTLYATLVPGKLGTSSDPDRYVVSDSAWATMMDRIKEGQNPTDLGENLASVNPTAVTVEIRNGGGINGAGAAVGEILGAYGFKIEDIGNTNDATTYPETLVIYHNPAYETAAQAITYDIGAGRVINGGDYYTFSSDVLVIVGRDWVTVQ